MDFDELKAALSESRATDAASRREVYDVLRKRLRQGAPAARRGECLALENAIAGVEAEAMAALRGEPRPRLVEEDYVPPSKDKLAA